LQESCCDHRVFRARNQDLSRRPGGAEERGLGLRRRRKEVDQQVPEATGKNHAEAVHLVDQFARTTIEGQSLGKLKLVGVERPAGCGRIVGRLEPANPFREIFSRAFHEVLLTQVRGNREQFLPGFQVAKCREDCDAVAKGLVKRSNLEKVHRKEVRPYGVEQSVADLMGDNVGAGTGKESRIPERLVKERETGAIIERVHILPIIVEKRELASIALPFSVWTRGRFPCLERGQGSVPALPKQELRRSGRGGPFGRRTKERETRSRRWPVGALGLRTHWGAVEPARGSLGM